MKLWKLCLCGHSFLAHFKQRKRTCWIVVNGLSVIQYIGWFLYNSFQILFCSSVHRLQVVSQLFQWLHKTDCINLYYVYVCNVEICNCSPVHTQECIPSSTSNFSFYPPLLLRNQVLIVLCDEWIWCLSLFWHMAGSLAMLMMMLVCGSVFS